MARTRLKDRQTDIVSPIYLQTVNCFCGVYKKYIILGSYWMVPLDMMVQILVPDIGAPQVLWPWTIGPAVSLLLMVTRLVFV